MFFGCLFPNLYALELGPSLPQTILFFFPLLCYGCRHHDENDLVLEEGMDERQGSGGLAQSRSVYKISAISIGSGGYREKFIFAKNEKWAKGRKWRNLKLSKSSRQKAKQKSKNFGKNGFSKKLKKKRGGKKNKEDLEGGWREGLVGWLDGWMVWMKKYIFDFKLIRSVGALGILSN